MNIKRILSLFMASAVVMIAPACSSSEESSSDIRSESDVVLFTEEESSLENSEDSEKSSGSDKPVLSLECVEISSSELDSKNGTVVPVDYSVSGIENGWSSSGIHIAFDNRLDVETRDDGTPSFERGDASEYMNSVISTKWMGSEPPEQIAGKNMDNISIITASSSNKGLNGVIATINFIVPADAQPGDVYEISFFKYDLDCFKNSEDNADFQNFAFENWQNGYIKITE